MVTYSIKLNDNDFVSVKRRKNELNCHCYIRINRKNFDLGSDWINAVQRNAKRRLEKPLEDGGKKTFLMLSEPHNSLFLKKEGGKVTLSCHSYDGELIKAFNVTQQELVLTKSNSTTDAIDTLLGFSNLHNSITLGQV